MKIKPRLCIGVFISALAGSILFFVSAKFLLSSIPNIASGQVVLETDKLLLYSTAMGCAAFLVCGLAHCCWTSQKITTACETTIASLRNAAQGDLNCEFPTSRIAELGNLNKELMTTLDALKHRIGFAEGVLNAIADAYPFMTCDQNARINFIGKQLLKVSGKNGAPSEYIGMTIGGYIYGDESRKTRTDKVVVDGIRVEGETRIEGNGKINTLQFSADPIYDLDHKLIGALTIYFDLTEVREQQNEIEENARRVAPNCHRTCGHNRTGECLGRNHCLANR